MNKIRSVRTLAVLVLLSAAPCRLAFAQQAQKPLTNDGVVRMVKAKLAESVIVAAIQSSSANFDISPDGLIKLQNAGVTQNELDAILAAQKAANGGGPAAAPAQTQPSTSVGKSSGRSKYDAITLDRGVNHDTEFEKWANATQPGARAQYGPNLTGVLPGPPMQGGTEPWQKNRIVSQAMAHMVPVGPKPSAPRGFTNGIDSTLIGLLRRQSAVARSLLPAFMLGVGPAAGQQSTNPGGPLLANGANQNRTLLNAPVAASQGGTLLNGGTKADDLNPQPYPPKGAPTQVGPSQTMSVQGSAPIGAAQRSSATMVAPNGPTRQQPVGGGHPAPSVMTRAATAAPTQVCMKYGIGTVDGQTSGVYFSPISGPEGTFVIQGCGFGTQTGEVYLSGVHYPNTRNFAQRLGVPTFPDRVTFQIPANGWSERKIVANIDANASGLYDTKNVTMVVKTASGQIYQATGFNFGAAYDFQTLTSVPQSPTAITLQLAKVTSPIFETPWIYSTPQHTLGVNRNRVSFTLPGSYTFPGGTDSYQFYFAPGFRLANDGVQLYHSDMTKADCDTSPNGQFSTSGNWGINYTSPTSVQISWQEQGCWPASNPGNALNYASVSVYSLWITVWGPRGVSPW